MGGSKAPKHVRRSDNPSLSDLPSLVAAMSDPGASGTSAGGVTSVAYWYIGLSLLSLAILFLAQRQNSRAKRRWKSQHVWLASSQPQPVQGQVLSIFIMMWVTYACWFVLFK